MFAKLRVRRAVRGGKRADDELHSLEQREYVQPYDFVQAALHPIPLHGGVFVAGDDHPGPRTTEKGSDIPNLEMHGSESLPLLAYPFKLSRSRQPTGARKPVTIRPRRISREV